jgi:hypothetical protein
MKSDLERTFPTEPKGQFRSAVGKAPIEVPRPPVAQRMREAILKAAVDGVADDDEMVLRMTIGDMELLKRDRNVAVEDISFADGEMRFLGVRIVRGNIATSRVGLASDVIVAPEAPVKKKKAPAVRKAAAPKKPTKAALAKAAKAAEAEAAAEADAATVAA